MQKLSKKNTKPVRWKTQGGEFQKNYQSKVEIVLPELDTKRSITWNYGQMGYRKTKSIPRR